MITSGFFNSSGGDRLYDAEQISEMFNGMVKDGILSTIGDVFLVTANGGMNILVGTGRAWFNSTWTKNDSSHSLTVDTSEPLLDRIDTVVLVVDHEARANDIILKKGTPGTTPSPPSLTQEYPVFEYGLADIMVYHNDVVITQSDITNRVGTTGTPFATSILQQVSISDLLVKWETQFTEWFDTIVGLLSGDIATSLQNQIFDIVGAAIEPPFPTDLTFLKIHTHGGETEGKIPSEGIVDAAITTNKIGPLQVTASKLASASVTESKIASGAIISEHLSTTVAGNGLAGGNGDPLRVNVDGSTIEISGDILKVKDGGVSNSKLASNSVTGDKIAANTITSDKIANRTRKVFIPYSALEPVGLSYLHDGGGSTGYKWGGALEFLENTNYALGLFQVPSDYSSGSLCVVNILWYHKATTPPEKKFRCVFTYELCHYGSTPGTLYASSNAGTNLEASLVSSVIDGPGGLVSGSVGYLTLSSDQILAFGIHRNFAHADDTPGTVGLVGLELQYTADS